MAPSIFHVGVTERVSVQVGAGLLNKPVTCYLEQEVNRVLMSKRETIQITDEGKVGTLELQVNKMYLLLYTLGGDFSPPSSLMFGSICLCSDHMRSHLSSWRSGLGQFNIGFFPSSLVILMSICCCAWNPCLDACRCLVAWNLSCWTDGFTFVSSIFWYKMEFIIVFMTVTVAHLVAAN